MANDLVLIPGGLEFEEIQRAYDRSRLDSPPVRSPRRTNQAIDDTFDLIGGVPRLAIWADQNPGEFFTKLLPKTIQSQQATEHSGQITIVTAIPRSPLDGEYTDVSDV